MGDVLSKAADGVGSALAAPFKAMLGESCEDVCSGVWDIICFITHLCVSDLMRLFMILVLCYITLLFFYLFFKLGVCQCIGKTVCKMYCSACKAYWSVLRCMACFFWHKLTNVKRVNRRRRHQQPFPDIENNESSTGTSSGGSSLFADRDIGVSRKRKLITKEMESNRHHNHRSRRHRHHHHRINKKQVDVQVNGRSLKLKKLKHHHPRKNTGVCRTETTSFKRRRLV